ncbi:MAG: hypothetical protein ACI8PB_002262 [Desulforhopalus sp.]|jgi:hypothetical protein
MLIAMCRTTVFVRLTRQVVPYILLFFVFLSLFPTAVNAELSRPGLSGRSTAVTVDIYVLDLDEVNTASQTFDANVFVELSWQDARLEHNEASALSRKLSDIWSPRIQIANLQRSWKTFDEKVKVNSDGTVIYAQRYWGSFPSHCA